MKAKLLQKQSAPFPGPPQEAVTVGGKSHIEHLNDVLAALKALPYARFISVFGSAAAGKARPGDLDIFLNFSKWDKDPYKILWQYSGLLKMAREHYGYLDPFLKVGPTLYTRDDNAAWWQRARKSKEILEAISKERVRLDTIAPFTDINVDAGTPTTEITSTLPGPSNW